MWDFEQQLGLSISLYMHRYYKNNYPTGKTDSKKGKWINDNSSFDLVYFSQTISLGVR